MLKKKRVAAFFLAMVMLLVNVVQSGDYFGILADNTETQWAENGFDVASVTSLFAQKKDLPDVVPKEGYVTAVYSVSDGDTPVESGSTRVFSYVLTFNGTQCEWKNTVIGLTVPIGFELNVESILSDSNKSGTKVISYTPGDDQNEGLILFYLDGRQEGQGFTGGRSFTLSWSGTYPTEITNDGESGQSKAILYTEVNESEFNEETQSQNVVTEPFKITNEVVVTAKADNSWIVKKEMVGEPTLQYMSEDGERSEVYRVDYLVNVIRSKTILDNGSWAIDEITFADTLPLDANGNKPVKILVTGRTGENAKEATEGIKVNAPILLDDGQTVSWGEENPLLPEDFTGITDAQKSKTYELIDKILISAFYDADTFKGETEYDLANQANITVKHKGSDETKTFLSNEVTYQVMPESNNPPTIDLKKYTSKEDTTYIVNEQVKNVTSYDFTQKDQTVDYYVEIKNEGDKTVNYTMIDNQMVLRDQSNEPGNLYAVLGEDYWYESITLPKYDTERLNSITAYYTSVKEPTDSDWIKIEGWDGSAEKTFSASDGEKILGFKVVANGMMAGYNSMDAIKITSAVKQRPTDDLGSISNNASARWDRGGQSGSKEETATYTIQKSVPGIQVAKTSIAAATNPNAKLEYNIADFTEAQPKTVYFMIEVHNNSTGLVSKANINDIGLAISKAASPVEGVAYKITTVELKGEGLTGAADSALYGEFNVNLSSDQQSFDAEITNMKPGAKVYIVVAAEVTRDSKNIIFDAVANTIQTSYSVGSVETTLDPVTAQFQVKSAVSGEIRKVVSPTNLASSQLYDGDVAFTYTLYPENSSNGYLAEYKLTDALPTFSANNTGKTATELFAFASLTFPPVPTGIGSIVVTQGTQPAQTVDLATGGTIQILPNQPFAIDFTNIAPEFNKGAKTAADLAGYYGITLNATLKEVNKQIAVDKLYSSVTNQVTASYKNENGSTVTTNSSATTTVTKTQTTGAVTKVVDTKLSNYDYANLTELHYDISAKITSNASLHQLYIGDSGPKLLQANGTTAATLPAGAKVSDYAWISQVEIPVSSLKASAGAGKLYFQYMTVESSQNAVTDANKDTDLDTRWITYTEGGTPVDFFAGEPSPATAIINADDIGVNKFVEVRLVFEDVQFDAAGLARDYNGIVVTAGFNNLQTLTNLGKIKNEAYWGYRHFIGGAGSGRLNITGDVVTGFIPKLLTTATKTSTTTGNVSIDLFRAGTKKLVNYTLTYANAATSVPLNEFIMYDQGITATGGNIDYRFNKITLSFDPALGANIPVRLFGYSDTITANSGLTDLGTELTLTNKVWTAGADQNYKAFRIVVGNEANPFPAGGKITAAVVAEFSSVGDKVKTITNTFIPSYKEKASSTQVFETGKTAIFNISAAPGVSVTKAVVSNTAAVAGVLTQIDTDKLLEATQTLTYGLTVKNTGNVDLDEYTLDDNFTTKADLSFTKTDGTAYVAAKEDYTFSKVIIPETLKGNDVSVKFKTFEGAVVEAVKLDDVTFVPPADKADSIQGYHITIKNVPKTYVGQIRVELTLNKRGFQNFLGSVKNNANANYTFDGKTGTSVKNDVTTYFTTTTKPDIEVKKAANIQTVTIDQLSNDIPVIYTITTGISASYIGNGGVTGFKLTDETLEIRDASNALLYSTQAVGEKAMTKDIMTIDKISTALGHGEDATFTVVALYYEGGSKTIPWEKDSGFELTADAGKTIKGFVINTVDEVSAKFKGKVITVEATIKKPLTQEAREQSLNFRTVNNTVLAESKSGDFDIKRDSTYKIGYPAISRTGMIVSKKAGNTSIDRTNFHVGEQIIDYTISANYNSGNVQSFITITDDGPVFYKNGQKIEDQPDYSIKEMVYTFTGTSPVTTGDNKTTLKTIFIDANQNETSYDFDFSAPSAVTAPAGTKKIEIAGENIPKGMAFSAVVKVKVPQMNMDETVDDYDLIQNTASFEYGNEYYDKTKSDSIASIRVEDNGQKVAITKRASVGFNKDGSFNPEDMVEWTIYITNTQKDQVGASLRKSLYISPILIDLLPAELSFVPYSQTAPYKVEKGEMTINSNESLTPVESSFIPLDDLGDFKNESKELRWEFKNETLAYGETIKVTFQTQINRLSAAGTLTNQALTTSNRQILNGLTAGTTVTNHGEYAGINEGGVLYFDREPISVAKNSSIVVAEVVRGDLDFQDDRGWTFFSDTGKVSPDGQADYKITVRNYGNSAISNVSIIDLLPSLTANDKSLLTQKQNGSEWAPILNQVGAVYLTDKFGNVTLVDPADYQFLFAEDTSNIGWGVEAAKNDLSNANRSDEWKAANSSDLSAKQAIMLDMREGFILGIGETLEFIVTVDIPGNVPLSIDGLAPNVAWSCIALGFQGSSSSYSVTEPPMAGLRAIGESQLTIAKKITGMSENNSIGKDKDGIVEEFQFKVTGPDGYVYKDEENNEYVTVKAGESVTIDGLAPGSYTIKEIGANAGDYSTTYNATTAPNNGYTIVLNTKSGETVEVVNTRISDGKLKVEKEVRFSDQTVDKNDPTEFTFKVTGPDGYTEEFKLKTGQNKELTGLAYGLYAVEEVNPNAAEKTVYQYEVAPKETRVTNALSTVQFVNTRLKPGQVLLKKSMAEGDIVKDEAFKFKIEGGQEVFWVTVPVNSNGEILELKDLFSGTYTITEAVRILNGVENNDLTNFKTTVSINGGEAKEALNATFTVGKDEAIEVVFNNERLKTGELTIEKNLWKQVGEEKTEIADWKDRSFTVGIKGKATAYEATQIFDNDMRKVTFSNLPYDTYEVYEVDPGWYYNVLIDGEDVSATDKNPTAEIVLANNQEQKSVVVNIDNVLKASGNLTINKKVLDVYGKVEASAEDSDTFTFHVTNEDAALYDEKITIKGTGSYTIEGLPFGNYTVRETGYDSERYVMTVDDTATKVEGRPDENASITFYNQRIAAGKITLSKQVVDKNEVPDELFTFLVTGPNGFRQEVQLKNAQTIAIPEDDNIKLTPGQYTITEIGVDSNDNLNNFTTTISINNDEEIVNAATYTVADLQPEGTFVAKFTNTRKYDGELSVVKVLALTTAGGYVAQDNWGSNTFDVEIKGLVTGVTRTATLTNDIKGVTFTGLPYDTYTVSEVNAPDRYTVMVSSPQVVIDNDNRTGASVVTNAYSYVFPPNPPDPVDPPTDPVVPPTDPTGPTGPTVPGGPGGPTVPVEPTVPPAGAPQPPTTGLNINPPDTIDMGDEATPLGAPEILEILNDEEVALGAPDVPLDETVTLDDTTPKGNPKTNDNSGNLMPAIAIMTSGALLLWEIRRRLLQKER